MAVTALSFAVGGCELLRDPITQNVELNILTPPPMQECAGASTSCEYPFTVELTSPLDHEIKVAVVTVAGTATVDATNFPDLRELNPFVPAVTIDAGATSAKIIITVYNDDVIEPDEDFTVVLARINDPNVIIGKHDSARGVILDTEDTAPVAQFAVTNNPRVAESVGTYNLKLFLVDPEKSAQVTTTLDTSTMKASGYKLTLPLAMEIRDAGGGVVKTTDIRIPPFIEIPAHTLDRKHFDPAKAPPWVNVPIYIRDNANPNSGNLTVKVTVNLHDPKSGGVFPGVAAPNDVAQLSTTFTLVESDGTMVPNDTGITQCIDTTTATHACTAAVADQEQDGGVNNNNVPPLNSGNFTRYTPGGSTDVCVIDQTTGLMWETKLQSGAGTLPPDQVYRSAFIQYDWYEPAPPLNGGYAGSTDATPYDNVCGLQIGNIKLCTTQAYILRANADKICGRDDWRLPKVDELLSIVDFSRPKPMLDETLFGPTPAGYYWTAITYAADRNFAWTVSFGGQSNFPTQHDGALTARQKHLPQSSGGLGTYIRLVTKAP